jgi:hypothetical protein
VAYNSSYYVDGKTITIGRYDYFILLAYHKELLMYNLKKGALSGRVSFPAHVNCKFDAMCESLLIKGGIAFHLCKNPDGRQKMIFYACRVESRKRGDLLNLTNPIQIDDFVAQPQKGFRLPRFILVQDFLVISVQNERNSVDLLLLRNATNGPKIVQQALPFPKIENIMLYVLGFYKLGIILLLYKPLRIMDGFYLNCATKDGIIHKDRNPFKKLNINLLLDTKRPEYEGDRSYSNLKMNRFGNLIYIVRFDQTFDGELLTGCNRVNIYEKI